MKILTTQSNYIYKTRNIHLTHPVLPNNCKNIVFHSNTLPKNQGNYHYKKYVCGEFTGRYHRTRYLGTQHPIYEVHAIYIYNKTGKTKGFAFKRVLAHVVNKLIKLDGITYDELRVGDATSTRKRTNSNTSNESQKSSVVVTNHT